MDKIFLDTNVIIDSLGTRVPFDEDADIILSLADKKLIEALISSLSFSNIYYILRKSINPGVLIEKLKTLSTITTTLNVNSKIIQLALNSDFKDFEDTIQYYTAIEGKANIIVTRNLKDFSKSEIPVLTPEDYIKTRILK